jgi:hypothetical protein
MKMQINNKPTLLWLDDVRNPFVADWLLQYAPDYEKDEVVWVKNYNQFVEWINTNGLPDMICFDHDLADIREIPNSTLVLASDWNEEKTGYDCAKWLVEYCMDNNLKLPDWEIQSANPVGRDNINGLLNGYSKFRKG